MRRRCASMRLQPDFNLVHDRYTKIPNFYRTPIRSLLSSPHLHLLLDIREQLLRCTLQVSTGADVHLQAGQHDDSCSPQVLSEGTL